MLADELKEVIFIGLPGPTHNYGGLSSDNMAAVTNRGSVSNPKTAALQVFGLVKLLRSLGVETAILPPQLRPHLPLLRQYYSEEQEELIRKASKENPSLYEKASSSSAMWVANAATVSPAIDNQDRRLHLTTANLYTNLHRRIEAADTYRVLTQIFKQVPETTVHMPLSDDMPDEGDANHMRLAPKHSAKGLHIMVYGTDGGVDAQKTARQSKRALEAIGAAHGIPANQLLLLQQNPDVIKQGVFHNDVIGVSNEYVLLLHEKAYKGGMADIDRIQQAYGVLHPSSPLCALIIHENQLSVEEAVNTYFFNSQIITKPDGSMAVIAPTEVKELYDGKAARLMQSLCDDKNNPIHEIHYADLRQSMRNGGGPACLRLRVLMNKEQMAALRKNTHVVCDDALIERLARIIEAYYPEQLTPQDVKEPQLYEMCRSMLTQLGGALKLRLVA